MLQTDNKKVNYHCEKCKYTTKDKKDFNKHKLTLKHNKSVEVQKKNLFECKKCGRCYRHRSGLSRHKNSGEDDEIEKIEEDVSINELYRNIVSLQNNQIEILKNLDKLHIKVCMLNCEST